MSPVSLILAFAAEFKRSDSHVPPHPLIQMESES